MMSDHYNLTFQNLWFYGTAFRLLRHIEDATQKTDCINQFNDCRIAANNTTLRFSLEGLEGAPDDMTHINHSESHISDGQGQHFLRKKSSKCLAFNMSTPNLLQFLSISHCSAQNVVLFTVFHGYCTYPLVNQHSYGKWPFIVDFPSVPIKKGGSFHSYVKLSEGISHKIPLNHH